MEQKIKKETKRQKKVANSEEQQYARHDREYEEYQYLDESKRVTVVPIEDKVIDNNFIMPKVKIRVVTNNTEQILTDHRNKTYKVQTKSQIRAVSDNPDSYKLQNNPREDEVVKINMGSQKFEQQLAEEQKKDMSNPRERYNPVKVKYKLEDNVKHIEEGIIGKVKFVGIDKIAILWNDGSRERFALSELNQIAYVDAAELEVSPLSNQMGGTEPLLPSNNVEVKTFIKEKELNLAKNKSEKKSDLDVLFEKALDDMEDSYDDIDNGNPNKLKEESLQRRVNTLEKKLEDNKITNMKEKIVGDMISLMKDKGMIRDVETEKFQKESIMQMDDIAFESFKTAILSMNVQKKSKDELEAEGMLKKIKGGGAIISTYDKDTYSGEEAGSRDLKSLATAEVKQELNFNGFKDIQGLTKPIQVIAEQKSPRQSIKDSMSNLDWTTVTKMF